MNNNVPTATLSSLSVGRLTDLVAAAVEREALMAWAAKLPSIKTIMHNPRELELLAIGNAHLWRAPFAARTRKLHDV